MIEKSQWSHLEMCSCLASLTPEVTLNPREPCEILPLNVRPYYSYVIKKSTNGKPPWPLESACQVNP